MRRCLSDEKYLGTDVAYEAAKSATNFFRYNSASRPDSTKRPEPQYRPGAGQHIDAGPSRSRATMGRYPKSRRKIGRLTHGPIRPKPVVQMIVPMPAVLGSTSVTIAGLPHRS